MLNNYIENNNITTRIVVYHVVLPSGMNLAVVSLVQTAKHGIMDMFKSVYNTFGCSPMIRVEKDIKLSYEDAVKYQAMLFDYFDKQKYTRPIYWNGSEDAYAVSSYDMGRALDLMISGSRSTKHYELPVVDDLVF